jgi:hypothetical protein
MQKINQDVAQTIFKHQKGKSHGESVRGLESFDPDVKKATEYISSRHSRSVFKEMERQKREGLQEFDWKKLQEASEKYSNISRQRALKLAEQDEQDKDETVE